jgi:histidinol-phosphate aminotransferase
MNTSIRQQRGLNNLTAYVAGKPVEEVQREYGIKDVIKLASNENPFGASPLALGAIRETLNELNRYPDADSFYLRTVLAEKLGFPIEQVTVGNGADGIIAETCMAFLDEVSEVVVSRTSFPVYDIYTNVMRATLIKIPMKNYSLDLEKMADAITERTKVIFLCNPNNPTGTIVTASEVDDFMKKVPDHVLVVFDEAYYELADSDEYPNGLDYLRHGQSNVMVMRSFSKTYGLAGIRLGYAVAVPEVIAALHSVKEPFAVNQLAQAAGIAALDDMDFLHKSVKKNHAGRLYLYAQFERLAIFYLKSHANFVLAKIGPHAMTIQQKLLERGVIVRCCSAYDLPEFLRISVGNEQENIRLIETLEEVLTE